MIPVSLNDERSRLLGLIWSRHPLARFLANDGKVVSDARRARVEAQMRLYEETGIPPFEWMINPLRARIDYQSTARRGLVVMDSDYYEPKNWRMADPKPEKNDG